jgi:CheY-like chemotaxis protein
VARTIRGEPWGHTALLIALTGWGQSADKERALAAGFDHHLTKPADPDALQSLIHSHFA